MLQTGLVCPRMSAVRIGRTQSLFYGSAREFGETTNWRRLECFALPGISGRRIEPLGNEPGRQTVKRAFFWGRGGLHRQDSRRSWYGRNSFLERDFAASRLSRIARFDLEPSIRLRWLAERARRPFCRVANGQQPPREKAGRLWQAAVLRGEVRRKPTNIGDDSLPKNLNPVYAGRSRRRKANKNGYLTDSRSEPCTRRNQRARKCDIVVRVQRKPILDLVLC